MLKFWKKSRQDKNIQIITSHISDELSDEQDIVNVKHLPEPPVTKETLPLASFDDEGLFDIGEFECSKENSRLSKTLQEIINDKSALNYFLNYMESRNASHYILCWMDIESFKSDLRNLGIVKKRLQSPVPSSHIEHDSLSVSTDCDSYTADSNSLCDYLTVTLPEAKTCESICDKDIGDSDNSFRLKNLNEDINERKSTQSIVDNALDLFKKYIAQESEFCINCSENDRKDIMENICNTEKMLSGCCFDSIQNYLYNVMENEYLSAFLSSDYFCKYQIDILTSGNVVLDDILYNETALFYLMEFLEQENQRSLLDFWIAASNFQQQLHDQKNFLDPVEAQNDAVVLYDKYFSLQAHCPLGFSDKVRLAVEQNICGENGLMLDCFHLPLKIVEKVLEKNYLKTFLASQLFYKYLSDLINTVQSNGYSTNIEKINSPSDCSSEKSFVQNTFLAFEVPNSCSTKKTDKCTEMTIDTRELYDPDALWKRRKFHRLSLGKVDELGKYETEFEPEPDRNEFKFRNVLKRVVSLDMDVENRKREEMAWQVAEMIVKDITKITLDDHTQ